MWTMHEHGITSWERVWNADETAPSLFPCPTKGWWHAQQKPKWTASAGAFRNVTQPLGDRGHLLELLSFMDGYVNHAEESFRKRASKEFNHIKFVFVEVGTTGFFQPADLAIMRVFKSDAKSLACAAYARDVLNMTDAIGLVKPKLRSLGEATQQVKNKNTYLSVWKYVRQYDTASHC
eukprot:4259915-Amphidinium_carterae.2